MTIALDYTRRKTILAVSLLGCERAPAWFRWYTHVIREGGKRRGRASEKALILQNPVVRVSISLYIRRFYTYCITGNVVYRTTADLKCNIHFTQCCSGRIFGRGIKYSVPLLIHFQGCAALSLHVNYKIKILIAHIKVFFVNLSSVVGPFPISSALPYRLNMPTCTASLFATV